MLRNLEVSEVAVTIVTSIGTMISIGLNLSPILLFYRYFKKTAELNTIPETMFITGIFCCGTNLAYGIIIADKILTISNGVCFGLQVMYGTIYIFIFNLKDGAKRIDKLILYLIIAWDLSFEVLFIFGNVLEYHTSNDFAKTFTGSFNIFIGTLNVITPGQNIIKVIKTGNFTLIPIVTIFFQCACSSLWMVYGFALMDPNIIAPNVIGTVITVLQILTYFYFYTKNHGIPPKTDEQNEEDKDKIKSGDEQKESPEGLPENEQKLMADSNME